MSNVKFEEENSFQGSGNSFSIQPSVSTEGIVGWLLKKGIIKKKEQGESLLLLILIILIIAILLIYFNRLENRSGHKFLSPAEIEQIDNYRPAQI